MINGARYQPQCADSTIGSTRAVLVWLAISAGAWFFVATIIGAPLLLSNGHPYIGRIIYETFSRLCHQIQDRSFFVEGNPFAVCARCTGLYVGFAAGVSVYPLMRSLKNVTTPPRWLLFLACVPIGVDFSLGFFGIWNNTHTSRFITGALLSVVSAFYVLPGLIELFSSGLRLWGPNQGSDGSVPDQVRLTTLDRSNIATVGSDYKSPWRRI